MRGLTVRGALSLGEESRQGSRQGVDLVGGEDRSVGQVGLVLGEQAFEPEQQASSGVASQSRD